MLTLTESTGDCDRIDRKGKAPQSLGITVSIRLHT